jgi:DNA-binding CsgD family transcriptional regulator
MGARASPHTPKGCLSRRVASLGCRAAWGPVRTRCVGDEVDILRAIERLYAAVAAPELWPAAIEGIVVLLRAEHAILAGHDRAAGAPLLVSARVDERDLARTVLAQQQFEQRAVMPLPGAVFRRSAMQPDREYRLSAHYNEVVRPLNGFHALCAHVARPVGGFLLTACRSEQRDDFDDAQAATLRIVLPHLSTAVQLRSRLVQAEHRSSSLAALLDRLDVPAMLVDAAGLPCFANGRAAALLDDADGLMIDRRGLAAATPETTRQLRAAIAAVNGMQATEHRMLLQRPSGRTPLLVTILPWRIDASIPGAPAASAAIFVGEPDAPTRIDRAALADIFRLTARESEVAVLLAGGLELPGIAGQLDLSVATVRTHVKRVFEKTGTHSQVALVALVRGFAIPVR